MKKWIYLLAVIIFTIFLSAGCICNEPILSLTYVEWYTTTEQINEFTFGYIHLNLIGSTSGDKVTVITYGDGIIEESELDLDQNNKFSQDIIIQFTHEADNTPRIYSTKLTAYKGSWTSSINLESEELTYLE